MVSKYYILFVPINMSTSIRHRYHHAAMTEIVGKGGNKMRKKLFRSFSSVVLVVVLLLSVASISASADMTATVIYDNTPAREGPGNNYKPLYYLNTGKSVTVVSMDSAGWCKVKIGGNTAYIHCWYLEQAKNTVYTVSDPYPAYIKSDGAALRVAPNEAYPAVTTLKKGQVLLVTEEHTSGWCGVLVNGVPGYVFGSYINRGYNVTPTSSGNYDAYVNTNGTNVRIGPDQSFASLASLPYGTAVHVDQVLTNGWCIVTINGLPGFINGSYLNNGQFIDTVAPTIVAASGTGYINTSGAEFRVAPNTQAPSMVALPKGIAVQITEKTTNGWVHITINGVPGWVYGAYINDGTYTPETPGFDPTVTKSAVNSAGVISANGAAVRTYPSSLAPTVATLPAGMPVQVVDSYSNGFYSVLINGLPGFVYGSYLLIP